MSTGVFFSPDELIGRRLEDPLLPPFDCRREAQNKFLHESAWHDQQEWISTTYLYYARGMLAAYATISASALTLGSRERPRSIRHKATSAIKLLQFGVDQRFQGLGVGTEVLADVIAFARECSPRIGCRFLALDAQPDLVRWYGARGFVINKAEQKQRIAAAMGKRPIEHLPVSMRFDLMEAHV
jgi:GNAT superfamily N-acetyltransferase